MCPVPIGMPGEIFIGGAGLARGYFNRPELTAERFVPNPFSDTPGMRLYKTDDLARYLPDSNVEYLGRRDHQVKIHGCRIELGEIEATLRQYPGVCEAVVVARENRLNETCLVAYLTKDQHDSNPTRPSEPLSTEQLATWQQVFNGIYRELDPKADIRFNFAGWNSSYTGQPFSSEEMQEFFDRTAERILSLEPQHVLEIGCGTGLLLSRVAPHCTQYWGTDFSCEAVNLLQQQVGSDRQLSSAHLLQRSADDFSGLPRFDLVILNSVVQYFPSLNYFLRVLEGALSVTQPNGYIFIGDLRNLSLLEAFCASLELHRASPTLSIEQLQRRIHMQLMQEDELVIDPALFFALQRRFPQLSRVEVLLKRGCHLNELTRFRYDVILFVGDKEASTCEVTWLDWQQSQYTVPSLKQFLMTVRPLTIAFAQVPNARLVSMMRLLDLLHNPAGLSTVSQLEQALHALSYDTGIDPENFWALGDELDYEVDVSWSDSNADCFDVIFKQRNPTQIEARTIFLSHLVPETMAHRTWQTYANAPMQSRQANQLIPELRRYLREWLPEFMIPSYFVLLPALPLTPNGKVDRKALPPPEMNRPECLSNYVPPQTETERTIANVWQEVLQNERVGLHDNFFDLGGNSLRIVRIQSKLQKLLGVPITIVDLFRYPTIALLAQSLTTGFKNGKTASPGQSRAETRKEFLKRRRAIGR